MEKQNTVGKQLEVGIDIMKFLCALLIVFMHTFCFDSSLGAWVKNNVTVVGVPFFFIASGYFFRKGLDRNKNNQREYVSKYLKRLIFMYLFWSVVTLPVFLWNIGIAHPEYGFVIKTIYIFRSFFLAGGLGIYWYLLSLIYGAICLYYAERHSKFNMLCFVAFCLFAVGMLYDCGIIREMFVGKAIYIIFGSTRNILNVGLFYLCIGYYVAKYNAVLPNYFSLVMICLLLAVSSKFTDLLGFNYVYVLISVFLFMLAKSIQCEIEWIKCHSIGIRKLSTALYLGHFPFILVFDYYLKRGTGVDFVFSCCFAVMLYFTLKKVLPMKHIKYVYG